MKERVLFNMLPTVNQHLGQHMRTGQAHLLLYFRRVQVIQSKTYKSTASDDLYSGCATKIKWQIALTLHRCCLQVSVLKLI